MKLGENRRVRLRYQRRRVEDIGFPDFAQPYFFNATSLPKSNLEKVSARYEAQAVTPWLANLSLSAYYQKVDRLLKNNLPVQFPAPTAVSFFPITVFRLSIDSETEQRVWTPGVDLQAVLTPARNHFVTTGAACYRYLTAQAAEVAGTAAHYTLHASTGALSAQAATVAGTALHEGVVLH